MDRSYLGDFCSQVVGFSIASGAPLILRPVGSSVDEPRFAHPAMLGNRAQQSGTWAVGKERVVFGWKCDLFPNACIWLQLLPFQHWQSIEMNPRLVDITKVTDDAVHLIPFQR